MLKLYISDKYSTDMLYHLILNVAFHLYLPYNDHEWEMCWVKKEEKNEVWEFLL